MSMGAMVHQSNVYGKKLFSAPLMVRLADAVGLEYGDVFFR
jgi:hypothetical protein